MDSQFQRTEMVLGNDAMEKLKASRVAVFGVGGVGGYVVEALARAGVGTIDVIDNDSVSITNINRQIIALHSTVGKSKVEVIADRIKDINPACKVIEHQVFFLPDTEAEFDFNDYDYVVDAIDTVKGKIRLVELSEMAGTPIIASMGTGNKLNPAMFEVADIYKTSVDPLARVMRRELKSRGIKKLKVVYSKEEPIKPTYPAGEEDARYPGSNSFVPPVAGLIIASEVIKDLIKGE